MRIYQKRTHAAGPQCLYIQTGDQQADDDELLGIILDPVRAKYLIRILNGDDPPFSVRESDDVNPGHYL
jgi:hypothetical protein